ncbi:hypothetical protein [Gluconobacter frateurii]|uniref:Uncharacterized protein n=1 Tax=Gluconobacter frateurii NRIC 0228 TaxID=1307946 RepID=A0ABQ0Q8X8_9PROT|nr:hypothetical protein [Gluconobacter frateurii]GBR09417.1 hypothetical protein AA0228_0668 [Gluconobacter frateurii NRIC 0228]GLP91969.1 hypothetical protein GCM10007868_30440 [Gluconobacter frateurii]
MARKPNKASQDETVKAKSDEDIHEAFLQITDQRTVTASIAPESRIVIRDFLLSVDGDKRVFEVLSALEEAFS